ncbi:LBF_2804 family protein [Parvicella tangerina]|uniref:Uncharacterized protein n=1 Tax=Parvicella tangerina TaxID=2829795 RepID=A0A916NT54_9FLAO|nr:hypothetical protein [Parvicella tangerina]CAG5085307.1 hypothetical protein CRYO30217_02719 [Parvicella tangerina]
MNSKNPLERYLYKKIVDRPSTNGGDDREHVLTEEESKQLKKIQFWSMFRAALAGAIGVVALYVPYHVYGEELFPVFDLSFPFLEEPIAVEAVFLLYSLILVVIEIGYLTYNNIHTVKSIAHTCNYPLPEDPFFETNVESLVAVGLERNIKAQSQIGINPFAGLSKWQVMVFTIINLVKAAMTNFLFKLIIKRALGRYAFRLLVDLAGIPVYAFWNAYAARVVIKESRVRIMANPIIKDFAKKLYQEQRDNPEFVDELYYMLDFVAITKRKFHGNHYMLALVVLQEFGIKPDPDHEYDKEFLDRMEQASDKTIEGFSKVNLMGMALDGVISKKEELLIYTWRKKGIYTYTTEQTKQATREFFEGQGQISLI